MFTSIKNSLKTKPLPLLLIALINFLSGFATVLLLPSIFIISGLINSWIPIIMNVLIATLLLSTSIGLYKKKMWSIYVFTLIAGLISYNRIESIFSSYRNPGAYSTSVQDGLLMYSFLLLLFLLMVGYLFSIRKSFK